MGKTDTEKGSRPPAESPRQNVDVFRNPNAVLLVPSTLTLPVGWQTPWLDEDWSITTCAKSGEIRMAIASPIVSKGLIAAPWPEGGDASTVGIFARGLQDVIASLGALSKDGAESSPVQGGMLRRADFLSSLLAVMRGASRAGFWVLMAVRVDQSPQADSQLDMRSLFNLEERIAARLATVLREEDAYTVWLELGFGVLVRREDAVQVQDLAKELCASIASEPFAVAGKSISLTVSIGLALPLKITTSDGADRWFASAHAAQAIAHRHGGNRYEGVLTREFEPIPAERVLIIREWVQEARSASNIMIEFQPVLPLTPSAAPVYSVHAKLRDYRQPLGGVYRNEYLGIAREAGAMVMIDRMSLFGAFEALEQERARGRNTRLLVPLEFRTLEGVPWRWLESELRRRPQLASGLIVEFEANEKLEEANSVERIRKLREFGVQVCLCDLLGGLEWVPAWSRLPFDVLRLQLVEMEAVPPEMVVKYLAPWTEQGRHVIVDAIQDSSAIARFTTLGASYLRGPGIAAIGPRLDFDFA